MDLDIHETFDDDEDALEETEDKADLFSEQKEPEPEEKVDEAKAEDTKAEEKVEEKTEEKTVPYAALHEERQLRKEAFNELKEMQRKLGQFESLRDELQAMRSSQESKEKEIDWEEEFENDPIAALRKQNEELQARLEQQETTLTQEQQQQEELSRQQQEFQDMLNTVRNQIQDFEADHPDYSQAFQFLMDKRIEEYRALGITDPQEIQMEFDREALALSANALQRGINAGQAVYDLAKTRGYTKTEALEGVQDGAADKTLQESMDRLERGSKASQSLTGGTGGKPEGTLTVAEIEKMSDAEFDKLWEQMGNSSIY